MKKAGKNIEFVVNDEHRHSVQLEHIVHSGLHAFGKGWVCFLTTQDLLKYIHQDINPNHPDPFVEGRDKVTHIDMPEDINCIPGYSIEGIDLMMNTDLKGMFNAPYGIEILSVSDNSLERIDLNGPIQQLNCSNNELTELNGSEYVSDIVMCENNHLSELHIAEGVAWVYCYNNNIKELTLPYSIKELFCDKEVHITNYHSITAFNSDIDIERVER